jgi:hypothetical protein
MMSPAPSRKFRTVTTRAACALLATGALVTLVVGIGARLHAGEEPTADWLFGVVAALVMACLFGLYASKGPFIIETGVLSEPSELVKELAIRRGSKIEAIKAYRRETGVDLRRANEVVERLASAGPREA